MGISFRYKADRCKNKEPDCVQKGKKYHSYKKL